MREAFTFRFPGSEALADAIGDPCVVDVPLRSGHLAGKAAERGAKVVAVELGGRSVDELAWRDLGTLEPVETYRAPLPQTALLLLRPHATVLEGGAMTFVVGRPA